MSLRRSLLIALVLATLLAGFGCATPDVICNVRQDYVTSPIPPKGKVTVTWEVADTGSRYGYATCDRSGKNCHIQVTSRPDYNDVCRVHDFGHELLHSMRVEHQ